MVRRFLISAILLTLLTGSARALPVNEEHPDTADWPSFSDDKVLEYLDNPFSGVRLYAGQEILRRWDEKKIIALCEKDWKRGQEVLADGKWPGDGAILETYLLGQEGPDRQRDAAVLLAGRRFPGDAAFDGGVGSQVRDLWFLDWITRIPRDTFFLGTVSLCLKHGWIRERLYRDDPWIKSWGAMTNPDGSLYYPWHLTEYRATVQILAGDPYDKNTKRLLAETQYFPALEAAVKTGKNTADVPLTFDGNLSDKLASSFSIAGVGSISYAELLAIVMDRADWVPAIEERLKVVEYTKLEPKFDGNGKLVAMLKIVTRQDARSPLVSLMAEVSTHRNDAAKASFKAYWRREWEGYATSTWQEQLLRRHPWFSFDKDLSAWYAAEAKPVVGDVDCEFLKGVWQ